MAMPMSGRRLRVVGRLPATDTWLPPGQHATSDLVAVRQAPPQITRTAWTLTIAAQGDALQTWSWQDFRAMPHESFCVDLHSELGWSKLATHWTGVRVRTLFADFDVHAEFARIDTYSDFTTNLPLDDLLEMPTWIADAYEGLPIPIARGGPARLLVPHLYLWKSAIWIRAISLSGQDEPGTRERAGWHNYGDPWLQQRFRDD
jgi:DMSO/TMAO reductase YedYZ molybdopterin-dependent catalytic subunit